LTGLAQCKRRTRLETWLEVELHARFAGRIVPIDAAIALHHNLTVVSRNGKDFTNTHVPVLNPWEA
jgi:predicted nucleic acid-binding protein